MFCVLCGSKLAIYMYGVCNTWWFAAYYYYIVLLCGGVQHVIGISWCFVVVWQLVIGMVCVLCVGFSAFHIYGVCLVFWCGNV